MSFAKIHLIKKLTIWKVKKYRRSWLILQKNTLPRRNINVHVEFSWGATEAKVVEGLVDAVVEVTETGSTIKANKLRIIHELMKTNTQLIANRASWNDSWKRKKIEQIRTMLTGSLQAMGKVGLKLNVSKENLKRVMSLLPSLKSPTISSLSSQEWFAVESIVDAKSMRDLIPVLLEAGAQGIIEYPLNKVV